MEIKTNEGILTIHSGLSCYLCDSCDSHRNNNLVVSKKDNDYIIYICSYHVSSNDYDEGWESLEEGIKQQ